MSESGNDYTNEPDLPDIVRRAAELAANAQFRNSCAVAYGRLLRVLAAQADVIGEMGTGCGVGTAWMLSGARRDSRIVTIEKNGVQVAAVRALFADEPRVTVLHGDALELAAQGPFDLLYADALPGKHHSQDVAVAMVRPGGTIVIDDLTPGEANGLREWWLNASGLQSLEITLADGFAAILAVRR